MKEDVYKQENLSKKERRQFKREQKNFERRQEIKKTRLRKWGSGLGVGVLLVGGFFLFNYSNNRRYEEAPKIQVVQDTFNFGKVLAFEGIVKTNFEVKNIGVSPLIVSGMESSCGCTTTTLKVGGEESPRFGMHDNPTDWSVAIEPEDSAELMVFFDPDFHKNTSGPVTRTVSIFSNDPGKSEEKVTIYANIQR